MRSPAAFLLVLLACTPTPDESGDPPAETGDTAPPGLEGDALVFLDRSDTASFWESTDVAAVEGALYSCTGVASFGVHDISDPEDLQLTDTLYFPWQEGQHGRCTHIDLDGVRLVVVAEQDEIQPVPGVALLDISVPLQPSLLDAASREELVGLPSIRGDSLYVAAGTGGVLHFDLSGSQLDEQGSTGDLGNVLAVEALADGVAVASSDAVLSILDGELETVGSMSLPAAAMDLMDLGDDRLAVAMGSAGLALVDLASRSLLGQVATQGTALRLDRLDSGELLVTNWSDLRIYDVDGDLPDLIAVDAVFEAGDQPRHFGAATTGELVFSGEWTGVYALRYSDGVVGPELTPSDLALKVPADGAAQQVELELLNEGQLDLVVESLDLPSGWSSSSDSVNLAAGEATTLELSFEGATTISRDWLEIQSNDADEPTASIALQIGAEGVFVGDEAPGFSYSGLNTGETHTLSDQRGKVVLLSYFSLF